MRIETVDLVALRLPLTRPWETAHGFMDHRDVLLVHLRGDEGEGWGECGAFAEPSYSPEFVAGAQLALRDHLVPLLLDRDVTSASLDVALSPVIGHRMAKAALEMAVLDCELRVAGRSFAEHLGVARTHVDAGVAVGFVGSPAELCDRVAMHVDAGYRRVKLKVAPGHDLEYVAAVRDQFPALTLQVDANGAYDLDDLEPLSRLDEFGLALIEQPLDADDLLGHAVVADRLATPICLDEPLVSLAAVEVAVQVGACEVVNLKAARVGGYREARRIHDWCLERQMPLWCGGMLETGVGRAPNVALAALDGFTLTGDLAASSRFYPDDVVVDPIEVVDGRIEVPRRPGMGAEVDPAAIERFRIA